MEKRFPPEARIFSSLDGPMFPMICSTANLSSGVGSRISNPRRIAIRVQIEVSWETLNPFASSAIFCSKIRKELFPYLCHPAWASRHKKKSGEFPPIESVTKRFEQIHLGDMEHGLAMPVAQFRLTPKEAADRLGIAFEITRDDLDYLHAALLRLDDGAQVALIRHIHSPSQGIELLINERTRNIRSSLNYAMDALELSPALLSWIRPDAE